MKKIYLAFNEKACKNITTLLINTGAALAIITYFVSI